MSDVFSISDLEQLFLAVARFSDTPPDKGTTRLAFSEQDENAHHFLINLMKKYGLQLRQDKMGNVFARLPGRDPALPVVGTGSHIDTVPQGGNFDGVVGVLTGLYALLQFKPGELKRSLELIIFRAEESSRFGFSCIGSKAITGHIDAKKWALNTDKSGATVFDAVKSAGYSDGNLTNENCQLPPDYFSAFVETHIEQGKRLEADKKRIGIVNGIAAPSRFCIRVEGQADHSGATPMHQRSDALVAAASVILAVNLAACKESVYGTVGTVGKLDVVPNSMNVIPGEVTFYVDIRGIDSQSIQRVVSGMKAAVDKAQIDNAVTLSVREISQEAPVKLSDDICDMIADCCREKNIDFMTMLSGAGHDSMYIAQTCPTAMIFIPSRSGISHHKNEFSEFADIALAAELLQATLAKLANAE